MTTIDTTKKIIKTVAVYGRTSTPGQEEEQTIRTQLLAVKEFAEKNGYTITQEYRDEGWSGSILARPQLDQLRNDAKQHPWDAILIYDPDRLARRGFYQELVIDELEQLRIPVLFVTMPPVVNPEDKLMFGVRGLFAEYERTKIAERFRLGKVRKAKEGNIIASEAPYGLTLVPRRGKFGDQDFVQTHYEVNETEKPNLEIIFNLVDDGLTLRKVIKRLQDLGIKPRKSKRGVWNTSTLSTMLRNESYIGKGYYGASYAVVPANPLKKEGYRKVPKSSRKIRPREEWIHIPVPATIDSKLFERVQLRLKENSALSCRNKKNEYLFAGKFRCVCNSTRAGEGPQHGKYLYYRCSGRVNNYPLPPTCIEKGINARIADERVWSGLEQFMTSPELLLNEIRRWEGGRQKAKGSTADIETMEKELTALKVQEDRYTKAYATGQFTMEKLQEYTAPIKERVRLLRNQIAEVRTTMKRAESTPMPSRVEIETFAKEAAKTLKGLNFEGKRVIVMDTVDKVMGTPRSLQVSGYVAVTNHINGWPINRHRRLTERGEVHPF